MRDDTMYSLLSSQHLPRAFIDRIGTFTNMNRWNLANGGCARVGGCETTEMIGKKEKEIEASRKCCKTFQTMGGLL
ncbi:unnamed protein product [Sphenostylis stenocarpa]|uniref:Uncharacterized protein n=1 Tax=Sphenostylis stenocarpa TaxID=92480 RepID=A0AA86VQ85_9FABA|nr:unnamed protein product [Sphenostylis stenocarpa]